MPPTCVPLAALELEPPLVPGSDGTLGGTYGGAEPPELCAAGALVDGALRGGVCEMRLDGLASPD